MGDLKPPSLGCPHCAGLLSKELETSSWTIAPFIRDSFSMIHFGESSMQRCEIMLNDLIGSKRTNANIKATIAQASQRDNALKLHHICISRFQSRGGWCVSGSSGCYNNFFKLLATNRGHYLVKIFSCAVVDFEEKWQVESLNIPNEVDQLLSDYAKRFHQIKTPRKLLWMKNLGTVKMFHGGVLAV